MPLENAPVGSAGFSTNEATEIRAGKPPAQAAAIAYSKARGDSSSAFDKLFAAADALYAKAAAVRNDSDCEADAEDSETLKLRRELKVVEMDLADLPNTKAYNKDTVKSWERKRDRLKAKLAERGGAKADASRKDSSPAWEIRRDGDEWEALGTSGGKPKAYRLPVKEFATEADAMAWVEQNEESKMGDDEA